MQPRAAAFIFPGVLKKQTQGARSRLGRALLAGGVALDALMVLASCFFELDPPRLAQGCAVKAISG